MKPDDVGRLAKLYGKVTGKEMTHRDEAALAGHMAAEGLGLMIGGPILKGGLKVGKVGYGAARVGGAAALKAGKKVAGKAVKAGTKAAKSAKATAVKTGKAVGRAARTGVTKAKTGARKLKDIAKKADAALLRAQKLARGKGGKLTKTTKKKLPAKKKPAAKKPVEKLTPDAYSLEAKKELILDYIAKGGKRKKPTGKKPTKPRITKVPRRKSAVKKAPAKKPAVKKAAAKKPATPKQAMQSLIDEVAGLRVGAKKPRVVPKKKPAAKKPAAKKKKK